MTIALPLLLSAVFWLACSVLPIGSTRKVKRITDGVVLPSHDAYLTYSYALVRRDWSCQFDPSEHSLFPCQEEYNACGGTLIHPEFVLTTAYCLMYYEISVKEVGSDGQTWLSAPGPELDNIWDEIKAWFKAKWRILATIILPKTQHLIYSNWAIFVGSTNISRMTQKRHVRKVYPHSSFPILGSRPRDPELLVEFKQFQNSYHDISLLRTCQPFDIKQGQVELAKMLDSSERLRKQYDNIVRRGLVCLYVGFGHDAHLLSTEFGLELQTTGKGLSLLHTWRGSICNSKCNRDKIEPQKSEHTCMLCSKDFGSKLGTPVEADYGGPVMCDYGYFVATLTTSFLDEATNVSTAGAYPLHCVKDLIQPARLKHLIELPDEGYHPFNNKRLRRFPMPPESHQ